jgi:hypothetical protein
MPSNPACFLMDICLAYFATLKIEVIRSSEKSGSSKLHDVMSQQTIIYVSYS